jgi:hypothetical protein
MPEGDRIARQTVGWLTGLADGLAAYCTSPRHQKTRDIRKLLIPARPGSSKMIMWQGSSDANLDSAAS